MQTKTMLTVVEKAHRIELLSMSSASPTDCLDLVVILQALFSCRCTHLIQAAKLNVMALNDIDVGELQPGQRLVHAGSDSLRTEIKRLWPIPPNFGGHHNLISRQACQALAKHLPQEREWDCFWFRR